MNDDKGSLLWRVACRLEEEGKLEEAISTYKLAAERGSVDALTNLGTLYADKYNPPQIDKAVECLRSASALGSAPAAWNLALHYKDRNERGESDKWMKLAAELGDQDAIRELAARR